MWAFWIINCTYMIHKYDVITFCAKLSSILSDSATTITV